MGPFGGRLEPWIAEQQVLEATDLLRAGVHEVGRQLLLVPVPLIPRLARLNLAIWGPALPLMMVSHGIDRGQQSRRPELTFS